VYFDASALVKLIVDEQGSDLAAELWDVCDAAVSSRLAYPEVRAALAAAYRNHDLPTDGYRQAVQSWHEYWSAIRAVELTPAVEQAAGRLAETRALRPADAIHLASALALGEVRPVLAVWDARLHAAAIAEGLGVAPAQL
jgi:predicted nucleic acid-binding protein